MGFIQAEGNHFTLDGRKIMLRGWAFGSWMNFEHFMIGLPGTNSQIIDALKETYGVENTELFLDKMLESMISEDDILFLQEIGVNSVRIPFGYHYMMSDDQPFVMNERGFQRLDRVVKLCEKHGLYVILDLHSTPGSQNTDWHSDNTTGQPLFWKYRCFQDQVIWLWEQLAARYANNEMIAGYDVLNEPGYGLTSEKINGFYDRVISAIRKVDQNHILFLEGTDFGRDFSPLREPDDPNTAFTVHFYPFVLEENVLDHGMDDAWRMQIFTEIFDRQLGEVARLNRPVWCGETGYEIQDGQEDFYAMLLLHNISIAEERGISWNLWTYKDARCMGIVIPKHDSPWMHMVDGIAKHWSHHREEKISMTITRELGDRFYAPLTDLLAYDLDFQLRHVIHVIAVEQVLKPALAAIPFHTLMEYPDAFVFCNCEQRRAVVDIIKHFIQQKEEN